MADANRLPQAEPSGLEEEERRAVVRYPSTLQAVCTHALVPNEQRAAWPATVRDLSTKGVGLILPRAFAPGTLLMVMLRSSIDQASFHTLSAMVIHATPQEDGQWLIGCEFIGQLPQAALSELL